MLSQFYNKAANMQTERISHYAVALISIAAMVLLSTQVWSVYRTSRYQPEVDVTKLAADNIATNNTSKEYQASNITESNLFGVASATGLDKLNLPTTALELQLRGAFTSSNQKLASAIIENPDGQVRSIQVGKRVFGNAILHAVYSDRIVLSRSGELETLYFPDPALSTGTADAGSVASNASGQDIEKLVRENMSLEEIQQAGKQLQSSAMTPEQRRELIQQRLLELRNRARQKNR